MKKDYPIIIGKGLKKGIMGFLDRDRQANVSIVYLKKQYESGEEFDFKDIEKIQAVLHFCDRESIQNTINILKTLMKSMPGDKE